MDSFKPSLMALIGIATSCAFAKTTDVGPLPEPAFLDTVVSTNFPCAFGEASIREYRIEGEFLATPSNRVVVTTGRDADGDGVLSPEERSLAFGWDCGRWVFRAGARTVTASGDDVVGTETTAILTVPIGSRRPKGLAIAVGGASLSDVLPEGVYDPEWNMVRLDVSGVDRAGERISVRTKVVGFTFTIK